MDPADLSELDLNAKRGSEGATPTREAWIRGGGIALWLLLGTWLVMGAVSLSVYSWNQPGSLKDQVEGYYFHLAWGWWPSGILILYVPFFGALWLVRSGHRHLSIILAVSILARLALLPSHLILETDPYRYLWDGRVLLGGENPFRFAPAEVERALAPSIAQQPLDSRLQTLAAALERDTLHQEILSQVNNKKVPTIYFPTAQGAFALTSFLVTRLLTTQSEDEDFDWDREVNRALLLWKTVLFAVEIAVLWVLTVSLPEFGARREWVAVYGWCPLILKEYMNSGHFDPIVILLTLLAVRQTFHPAPPRSPETGPHGGLRRALAGCLFGLGAGCKLYPLLLAPLFIKRLGRIGVATLAGTLILLFAPFAGIGIRLFSGFAAFSERWEFNSSLVALLEWIISRCQDLLRGGPPLASGTEVSSDPLLHFAGVDFHMDAFLGAKLVCGVMLMGTLALLAWRTWREQKEGVPRADRLILHRCFLLLGVLLLASPVTDPWYVGWIVPFMCVFRNPAWLLLLFTQQVYYLYFWNDWDYFTLADLGWKGIPFNLEIARPLEYLPFYALLLYGWAWARKGWARARKAPERTPG
ncbi:MAG: DUF2029 domain-containing protein [Candidatus Omnitrophica bacterium]|nr:hypothetical protein [bacterium]NUN94923.1 DUF2029 domain-containing protein [Candidatus Omnitrophota bacterium]